MVIASFSFGDVKSEVKYSTIATVVVVIKKKNCI